MNLRIYLIRVNYVTVITSAEKDLFHRNNLLTAVRQVIAEVGGIQLRVPEIFSELYEKASI